MQKEKVRSVPNVDRSGSPEDLKRQMRDKLAWSVGSTLDLKYSGKQSEIMRWANRLAGQIVDSHLSPQEQSSSKSAETTKMELKASSGSSFHGYDAPAKKPF